MILPEGKETLRHYIAIAEVEWKRLGDEQPADKATWMANYIMDWAIIKTPPKEPFQQAVFLTL